jgi:1-acyl-sn-glycerol-3-phosphate acyltransferase
MLRRMLAAVIAGGAKAITGAQCQWVGCGPYDRQRIYIANHSSHLDFLLLWSALPISLRRRTRPVAAADYWLNGRLKRYVLRDVFNGVAIERTPGQSLTNPVQPMIDALDEGSSLILFPEGTRGNGEVVQDLRSGIYHLASARPDVELVPAWIENGYRVMPRGSFFPVPLLCYVRFGEPTRLRAEESKPLFLLRLKKEIGNLRNV